MKKRIGYSGVLALFILSLGSLSRADDVTRKYTGATRLMGVAAKAKYEGKDEIAWGEYARACETLAGIRDRHPDWNRRTVAVSLERCRQEMEVLQPESIAGSRNILDGQRRMLELLSTASSQAIELNKVIKESRGILKTLGLKEKKAAGDAKKESALEYKDSDGDGLSDEQESKLGTDPNNPDTDSDGLSDFEEVNIYKTDPLNADSDNDGLSDGFEVKSFNSNPLNPDTDGDGLLDGEEKIHGTDPNNPDTDGDAGYTMPVFPWFSGGTDKEEVDNGWDPLTHIQEKEDEFY